MSFNYIQQFHKNYCDRLKMSCLSETSDVLKKLRELVHPNINRLLCRLISTVVGIALLNNKLINYDIALIYYSGPNLTFRF
jgi:hypothetical protein